MWSIYLTLLIISLYISLCIIPEFSQKKSDSACLLVFQTFVFKGGTNNCLLYSADKKSGKLFSLQNESPIIKSKKITIFSVEHSARFQIYWMLKHLLNILDNFVLSGLLGYSPLPHCSLPIGQRCRARSCDWLNPLAHNSLFCFSCLNSKFSHQVNFLFL